MNHETVKSNIPKLTVHATSHGGVYRNGACSQLHYHDELELLPVYAGRFHCVVDDTDYSATAGEVIFINSRVPHSTYAEGPTLQGLLQFKETDFIASEIHKIIKYSARFQHLTDSPVRILAIPELHAAVTELLEEAERRGVAYDFYIRSCIFRILGCLYRHGIISNAEQMYSSVPVQKVIRALSYINSNYQENISLQTVSAEMGFDPSYFCRVFKTATGATFTEYLNFVRVCKAETLLAKSRDSILEISEQVGFSSVSYFNRIFKKYLGSSPRRYRTARYIAISKGEMES